MRIKENAMLVVTLSYPWHQWWWKPLSAHLHHGNKHDSIFSCSSFFFYPPLHIHLVFLPGKSHGQRSLVGYSPWGCKELGMAKQLNINTFIFCSYVSWAVLLIISWNVNIWDHEIRWSVSFIFSHLLLDIGSFLGMKENAPIFESFIYVSPAMLHVTL